ncbi:MAG: restriction endonuclease [Bacteroidota bacterium]
MEKICYSEYDYISTFQNPFIGQIDRYNGNLMYSRIFKDNFTRAEEQYLVPKEEWLNIKMGFSNPKVYDYVYCPYCKSTLQQFSTDDLYRNAGGDDDGHSVWVCPVCNFWVAHSGVSDIQTIRHFSAISVLKNYDIRDKHFPLNDLMLYLKKDSSLLKVIDPYRFEKVVAEFLRHEWKPCEVVHVGKPHDKGIDVILIISDSERWLIQCKRRGNSGAVESVDTVRKLLGTMVEHNILNGIVVTTADRFSRDAINLTQLNSLKNFGLKVKLTDFGILREIIPQIIIKEPWADFYDKIDLEFDQ